MHRFALAVLSLYVAVGCSSGSTETSAADPDDARTPEEQCEALREHLIELHFASAARPATSEDGVIDIDRHKAALRRALGKELDHTCLSDFDADRVACGLHAASAQEAKACMGSVAKPRATARR